MLSHNSSLIERLAEYSWKSHRVVLAQKQLSPASLYWHLREKQRGTVSSNTRFQTALFRQYSANLSLIDVLKVGVGVSCVVPIIIKQRPTRQWNRGKGVSERMYTSTIITMYEHSRQAADAGGGRAPGVRGRRALGSARRRCIHER